MTKRSELKAALHQRTPLKTPKKSNSRQAKGTRTYVRVDPLLRQQLAFLVCGNDVKILHAAQHLGINQSIAKHIVKQHKLMHGKERTPKLPVDRIAQVPGVCRFQNCKICQIKSGIYCEDSESSSTNLVEVIPTPGIIEN